MNYTSPFQQWLDVNMKGIIASPDIMLLIAKAFEGGRLYEQKECANQIIIAEINAYDHAGNVCKKNFDIPAGIVSEAFYAKVEQLDERLQSL